MISPINILIGILWFVSAVVDYADFGFLWQLKEYRRDRFRDFLSTEQGRRYFFRIPFFYRFFGLLIAIFWPINDIYNLKLIILAALVIDGAMAVSKFFKHRLRRPRPTMKALIILGASLLSEAVVFALTRDWALVFFLFFIRFFVLTFWVAALEVPTRLSKSFIIRMATKKMRKFPDITVIGITGSYGKSSVKEFTAHLLAQKYTVIKTPRNINSEIGVAKFILQTDFSEAKFFIVEMGAYKKGEIDLICKMVKPTIGVLTAIGEQHLSLFGSRRNIQQAKYELLRSIPEDGYIITNADNDYCMELLPELKCQNIETFGTDPDNHPSCLITDIQSRLDGTEFEGTYKGVVGRVKTPVIGAHHANNVAAAALVAAYCGLNREEIRNGCASLPTDIQGSLKIYQYGNATIIDDSYNSNPRGFKSAIDVLASFPSERRRIVITRGMLELGDRSEELHEGIGEEIAFAADEMIVITKDFFEPLKRGVGEKYRTQILLKEDPDQLLEYVKLLKDENCVILIENRIPDNVYQEVSKNRFV